MEEFLRTLERIMALAIGLIILYIFLTTVVKVDHGTYITIARDILVAGVR
ncbi:MAG: hypothetical protein QW503_02300 [Sulfolobales archaeon]